MCSRVSSVRGSASTNYSCPFQIKRERESSISWEGQGQNIFESCRATKVRKPLKSLETWNNNFVSDSGQHRSGWDIVWHLALEIIAFQRGQECRPSLLARASDAAIPEQLIRPCSACVSRRQSATTDCNTPGLNTCHTGLRHFKLAHTNLSEH